MRKPSLFYGLALAAATLSPRPAFGADSTPPAISTRIPAAGASIVQLRDVEVLFDEDVQGVDAADLLINGVPATGLSAGSPGQYRFTFPQPPVGPVQVQFAAGHGITDLAAAPNAFAGASWSYTLDPAQALYQVRINEFMADNETGIRDQDGTFQDWIELYNGSPIAVELGGCYLTDRKDLLTRWRFPAFMLPPNTYLIVWASNKSRTNVAQLHTNFRLDPDPPGEYLALIDATGTNVISAFDPTYPAQRPDTSYGRDPLDPGIVGFYPGTNASPGRINTTAGSATSFAPDVVFSREGGTFVDEFHLTLSLSTPSPNAVIRYVLVTTSSVLDTGGTTVTNVPTTNSPIYTGPLRIDRTTQVRVRTFEPNKLPGTPVSVTYLQISPNVVDFTSDLPLIIVHNFGGGTVVNTSADRTAVIASFHADLGRSSLTNKADLMTRGAVNARGSSTGAQPKPSMAVEFWDEFNQDADRPLLDMPAESDWVLYAINGADPGLMHNAIFHWFGRNIGRYSSRTRYCEVFLKTTAGPITSNDYGGLYLLEEKPKRNNDRVNIESLQPENTNAPSVTGGYLLKLDRIDGDERTFATPDITVTNLFVNGAPVTMTYGNGPGGSVIVDYPLSIQWGTDPRRAAQRFYIADYFTNFLRALTATNFTDPELGYARYVDVDSWIENHIANTICFNVDGYRLSGYLFKDRNKKLEQGPPWDCDRCLGTGGSSSITAPDTDGRCFNPRMFRRIVTGFPGSDPDHGTDFFGTANGTGVDWWDRMFRDPDFWQKWIDRYQQFRTNQFANAPVLAMVDNFYEEIKEAQLREQARWSSAWSQSAWPRIGHHALDGYTNDFGPANPQFARGGYFTNEVNFQQKWLLDRLEFLDTNFLAMPVLNVGSSMVTNGRTITIFAAAKPGTLIYYTLDGTDPRLRGGGISPTALSSSGNLTHTISNNVRLFARCYNTNHFNLTNRYVSATSYEVGKPHLNSYWSGPVAATFYLTVPPLRITEIMYHPANPPTGDTNDPDNFEYLEVKNIGATPLNVNRFRLRGGVDFDFPNEMLAAGARAVIVKNVAAFQARYGAGPRILGSYPNDNLANDGDHLVLEGGVHEPILDFNYEDDWYPTTDGHGFSLQIVNDGAATDTWGLKSSWRASSVAGGTPSAADPGAAEIATVYVNEAMTKTDPLPADAIELHNPTGNAVNIGGWFLTDDFRTPQKYRIPDGTSIPANGYLVFYQSNSFGVAPINPPIAGLTNFALSSRGDEVYVFSADPAGNLTGWTHGYSFGPQANGVTFGRHLITSLGQDRDLFVAQTTPALGAANSGPKVGPIVISEIHYHPPDFRGPHSTTDNDRDEYIELQNTSGAEVALYDEAYPNNTWRLRDAVNFTFPVGAKVPGNGFVLVVSFDPADGDTLAAFRQVNGVPEGTPIFGPWNGKLDNSQDSIELVRPDLPVPPGTPDAGLVSHILVDKVNYQDTAPWPTGLPDGLGAALGRVDASAYGDDPANWRLAPRTPGAPLPTGDIPPAIVTQPANTSGIEGQSATFTLTATGSALRYLWTFKGNVYSETNLPVLTLTGLKLEDAGTYGCYVFNSAGWVQSSNVTLHVRQLPRIMQQPVSQAVRIRPDPVSAPSTNVAFTNIATSVEPPIHYQWRFNGVDIPGANSIVFTVNNVQLENEGDYSCAVTDGVSTVLSANARLSPWITPVVLRPPLGQTVVEGSDFSQSVEIAGNPAPFAYSWRRGVSTIIATNSGNYRSNFITVNTTAAGLVLVSNMPSSNYQMRLVVFNDANNSPGVLTAFTNTVLADFDRDGIPDVVESGLGLSSSNAADGALDLDGDGLSNQAEYVAGTDPNNSQSYLKIEQGIIPGMATVHVAAVSNRTYSVQFTDALGSGVWRKLGDIVARPANRVESFSDPTWTTNRFYRVVLPRQP